MMQNLFHFTVGVSWVLLAMLLVAQWSTTKCMRASTAVAAAAAAASRSSSQAFVENTQMLQQIKMKTQLGLYCANLGENQKLLKAKVIMRKCVTKVSVLRKIKYNEMPKISTYTIYIKLIVLIEESQKYFCVFMWVCENEMPKLLTSKISINGMSLKQNTLT